MIYTKLSNNMDTHKHGSKTKLSINRFSLFTSKLVIWKILLEIKTCIEKSSSLYWYKRRPLYLIETKYSMHFEDSVLVHLKQEMNCRRPQIFQTMNSVRSNSLKMNYKRFTYNKVAKIHIGIICSFALILKIVDKWETCSVKKPYLSNPSLIEQVFLASRFPG